MAGPTTLTSADDPADGLIGSSTPFLVLRSRLAAIARIQRTTLITGPTGVGKDAVARALHAGSPRAGQPFVPVHCGALPDTLIETELFGHSKGAFTGAADRRSGLIRSAGEGTLFLDEVDSLPLTAQAKLLRFLETGEYRAVGSDRIEHSSAWVLAATNRNLDESASRGAFRADLMYRLSVVTLHVPPLAQRAGDILLLAEHFLAKFSGTRKAFSEESKLALARHPWPGNVRELKNRVETAALFSETEVLDPETLGLQAAEPAGMEARSAAHLVPSAEGGLENALWALVRDRGLTLADAIDFCEGVLLRSALQAEQESRTRAAHRLGIHVRTLFKKLAGGRGGDPRATSRPALS